MKFADRLPPEIEGLLRRNGVDPDRVTEVAFRWTEGDPPELEVLLRPVADEVRIEIEIREVQ